MTDDYRMIGGTEQRGQVIISTFPIFAQETLGQFAHVAEHELHVVQHPFRSAHELPARRCDLHAPRASHDMNARGSFANVRQNWNASIYIA